MNRKIRKFGKMEAKYHTKEVAEILEKLIKQQRVQVAKAIMQQVAKYRQLQDMKRARGVNKAQTPTQSEIDFIESMAKAVLDDARKRKLKDD